MEPHDHGPAFDPHTGNLEGLELRDLAYSNIIDLFPLQV